MKSRPTISGSHWPVLISGVVLGWFCCVGGPIFFWNSPSASDWYLVPAGLLVLYLLKLWLERKRANTFFLLLFRSDGIASPLIRALLYPVLTGCAFVLLLQNAMPRLSHFHSIELGPQHPAFLSVRVIEADLVNGTQVVRTVSSPIASIASEVVAPLLACAVWPLIVTKLAWAVLQQYRCFLHDTERMRVSQYIDVLCLDRPGSTLCRSYAEELAVPAGYKKCVLSMDDYDPACMLSKASILLLVVESQHFQDNRLLQWLRAESLCRSKEALEKGPTVNIVYTKEGERRRSFLTVKFGVLALPAAAGTASPLPCPHPAYTLPVLLHSYLTQFGALPLHQLDMSGGVAASSEQSVWEGLDASAEREAAEPHLSLPTFLEYLRSCHDCGVHEGICRTRERVHHLSPTLSTWLLAYLDPSVRTRLWEFHSAVWNRLNLAVLAGVLSLVLIREAACWLSFDAGEWESVSVGFGSACFLWTAGVLLADKLLEVVKNKPPVVHNKGHFEEAVEIEQQGKPYSPPPESLRLAEQRVSFELPCLSHDEAQRTVDSAPEQLAVTSVFCFSQRGIAVPESAHYSSAELLKSAASSGPAILIRDPDILVEQYFVPSSAQLANGGETLLAGLQPGQLLSKASALDRCPNTELLASLLFAGVLRPQRSLPLKRWDTKALRASFHRDGYLLLPQFLPPSAFAQFQQYYRSVMTGYGGRSAADTHNIHFFFWNDEPLGRYYNHQLTQFFQKLLRRPLLHPGLAMGIWIMPGEGCPLHQDTSPPFDLTWDICIDHSGSCPRPLTFLFPSGPTEINLHPNDSIVFNGGVLPHVCGSLSPSPDNMHNVFLATWTYG